jgi:hypothetical protein
MYKLRFHLANGPHFMHWQLTSPSGEVTYHDPKTFRCMLVGTKLKNRRATAEKIHAGSNKTVCAWIEAEHFFLQDEFPEVKKELMPQVRYNPRVKPHWHFSHPDLEHVDLDNTSNSITYVEQTQIYVI